MAQTPNFKYPIPDETTANDFPTHMSALGLAIETEQSRQGKLANRPPAGVKGRLYFATTRSDPFTGADVAWRVRYYDDGTQWLQLNASAMQYYVPTFRGMPGANYTFHYSFNTVNQAEYQIMPGDMCWVNINQLMTLVDTIPSNVGVAIDLPVGALTGTVPAAGAQNHPAEAFIDPTLNQIQMQSGDYANNQYWQMNVELWFRATATFHMG